MKKIILFICIGYIGVFFSPAVFASSTDEDKWNVKNDQGSHPPHDHHENDHMKFLRGHGSERRKKKIVSR